MKKVNINTASREELQNISGIGEKMADAIVRYREEHGKFHSKEEINEIPGFSEIRRERVKANVQL
ncbi:MAG: helix-hairpin-helix domain-containing protein [Fibrobacter sp.]|nr:helix-hairpin-helix domain-containing protein [Fibrobacter sp.]